MGYHTAKTWSTTQAVVALSSGEAELYALTKGASTALGLSSLAADFGLELHLKIHTDASAAIGIVHRQGVGKLRHVRVQYLWIQSKVQNGDLSVHKVNGKENPADLMTKHLSIAEVQKHLRALRIDTSTDRATVAPRLARATQCDHDDSSVNEEGGGEDSWRSPNGETVREHKRARRTLFTPLRISGAPPVKALTPTRITHGEYCDNGQKFRVVDCWTSRTTAHRPMGRLWTGTTTFLRREDGE